MILYTVKWCPEGRLAFVLRGTDAPPKRTRLDRLLGRPGTTDEVAIGAYSLDEQHCTIDKHLNRPGQFDFHLRGTTPPLPPLPPVVKEPARLGMFLAG